MFEFDWLIYIEKTYVRQTAESTDNLEKPEQNYRINKKRMFFTAGL